MMAPAQYISPEHVLASIYGKTSKELKMSEKRRDEVITAAIFACFRNQEFGTRFKLPRNYREPDLEADARGVDLVVESSNGRKKQLQIKGIHLQRSIERRRRHRTKGGPKIFSQKAQRFIKRDSDELTKIMRGELEKILQDYSGILLLIHVIADLASQTSLEIAIRNNNDLVKGFKAKEVWFLRNMPVRAIRGKDSCVNSYAYKIIQATPYRHTYGFSFCL